MKAAGAKGRATVLRPVTPQPKEQTVTLKKGYTVEMENVSNRTVRT